MNKQKGFAVLEVLAFLVIVFILAAAGWKIWSSNERGVADAPIETIHHTDDKDLSVVKPEGWESYVNEEVGISFAYPGDWSFKVGPAELSETKSYYIGDLTSEDGITSAAITVIRRSDGRRIRTSTDEWKAYAEKTNTLYGDLEEIDSEYVAFRYAYFLLDNMHQHVEVKAFVYKVYGQEFNADLIVTTTNTNHIAELDQIAGTIKFAE